MPLGSNERFSRSWIASNGGASGANTPADLSPPRNDRRVAADRRGAPRAPAPPAAPSPASAARRATRSARRRPGRAAARSAAATGARASRPDARSLRRRRRRTDRCDRAGPSQNGAAAAGAIVSPPSVARAAATAAAEPRRRTIRLPFHQALASSGSGSPAPLVQLLERLAFGFSRSAASPRRRRAAAP